MNILHETDSFYFSEGIPRGTKLFTTTTTCPLLKETPYKTLFRYQIELSYRQEIVFDIPRHQIIFACISSVKGNLVAY